MNEQLRHRILKVPIPNTEKDTTCRPIWTYPESGTVERINVPEDALDEFRQADEHAKRHQLGQWPATAICGNDILSSVLYSSGLVAAKAGKLAPIPLILVSVVLYFFRFIYEEVVTAIPLNGGSYNVLLNTTSKRVAAFGAALGILSYLATGVVSGTSAVHYLKREVHDLPVVGSTIGLLFIFAILNLIGIGESAIVAAGIFFHHIIVLTVLCIVSFIYCVQNTSIFQANTHTTLPPVDFAGDIIQSNVMAAIFFGFSAAMLGITGFESSAQFVEEQQPGVFRKTLRNMWILVTIFNAALSMLSMGVLPMQKILLNRDTVLAEMGAVAGGRWLEIWVAIDAFLVLSGAVLTSYVGITGLVRRLAFDRVLPSFLSTQNKCRSTCHWIIILYFLIASSLVLLLNANTTILAGVYTYAFLGLMALFSFGCMVLKAKRGEIPRAVDAPWWTCIMGFILVWIGILGNLLGDPKVLMYFAFYLLAVLIVMVGMMERVQILKIVLAVMKKLFPSRNKDDQPGIPMINFQQNKGQADEEDREYRPTSTPRLELNSRTGARGGRTITKAIMDINDAPIVFFCKHVDLTLINKAILYVRKNEQTSNLRIVHVMEENVEESSRMIREEFENVVALFDCIYPKLKIDFILVHGEFERATIQWLAQVMEIPINLMFIAQPGNEQVHQVAALGVRVITA